MSTNPYHLLYSFHKTLFKSISSLIRCDGNVISGNKPGSYWTNKKEYPQKLHNNEMKMKICRPRYTGRLNITQTASMASTNNFVADVK